MRNQLKSKRAISPLARLTKNEWKKGKRKKEKEKLRGTTPAWNDHKSVLQQETSTSSTHICQQAKIVAKITMMT